MSECYKSFRTVSSVNIENKRPNSAKSSTTMIAMQKREKLKNLLIEKFIKKFSAEEHKIIIEKEVCDFIKQEKLTEIDLKNFEKKLESIFFDKNLNKHLKEHLENNFNCASSNISEMDKKVSIRQDSDSNVNYNGKKRQFYFNTVESNQNKIAYNNLNNNLNKTNTKTENKVKNSFLKSSTNKTNFKASANDGKNFTKNNTKIIYTSNIKSNNINKINTTRNFNNPINPRNKSTKNNNLIEDLQSKNNKTIFNKENDAFKTNLIEENLNNFASSVHEKKSSRPMSVRNKSPTTLRLDKKEDVEIDIEEIKNYDLKRLFHDEIKPLERINFDEENDEWQAIERYKQNLHFSSMKEKERIELESKMKIREVFDQQIKEKEMIKNKNKINEMNHHENLMNTIEKMSNEDQMKLKELQEKKMQEKLFREMQIKENIINKKKDYMQNIKNDQELLTYIDKQIEKDKIVEYEKKLKAKEQLKRTLEENELFKKRQIEKTLKEREEDKKAMEEYSKMLEKQDKERADYFRRCGERQKSLMDKMANTVIKEQEYNLKEEEMKIKKYQEDKDKRDKEDEDRKKLYQKNSKSMIKNYLIKQIDDKKMTIEKEKVEEDIQIKVWTKENEQYFKKEKETNERVKQLNILNAEFLKTQMKPKKKNNFDRMNDEEYRLNKDILDEIVTSGNYKTTFKKNFII